MGGLRHGRRRVGLPVAALVVAFVVFASVATTAAPASAATVALRPPVVDRDAPDPTVVRVDDTYYSFTTNVGLFGGIANVPVSRSSDLTNWTLIAEALPTLGSWAAVGFTWAPSVTQIAGKWVLYYTALDAASGRECIGVALANQVIGPYVDSRGAPLVCQLDHGGSIDPSPYRNAQGQWWLTWKSDDNAIGGTPGIWSQPLAANGQSLTGSPTVLLIADRAWETGIVEAPVFLDAANKLWLFYSAGPYASVRYAAGYAVCAGPSGPCTKQTIDGPWLGSAPLVVAGPGGQSFVTTPSGRIDMAFHGWRNAIGYDQGGYRAMYVEPVDFDTGAPRIRPDWGRLAGLAAVPYPILASRGDGTTDLLTTDAAGGVWRREFSASTWGDWDSAGGVATARPAAILSGDVLDVFVRGTDGALWHRRRVAAGWDGWESLGGGLVGGPTVASKSPGTLDVFVQGLDGALWHRAQTGGMWSSWEWLGGGMFGAPAVASKGPGKLDVFIDGRDGALWHRGSTGNTWAGWDSLGGALSSAPAVASRGGGQLDVFVRGRDMGLWQRSLTASTWAAWQGLGGALISDPSVASTGPGSLNVAVGGIDGDAWHRTLQGGAWSGWAPLGASS